MSKIWKLYKILAVTAVTVLIIDTVVVLFFSWYRPPIQKANAIVVLGAAINTPALYNRSLEGLRLYEAGDAQMIVASGGRISDKDISEAGYITKTIEANSSTTVPVILEENSHDTYENLNNTKSKIGSGKKIIIVSDEFHLARAVLMAERLGFKVVYWSSPKPIYYSKSELAFYYMREVFAMLAYVPKFVFN